MCKYLEHEEDLNLGSGEIVYLLEKVDKEWYRGRCKGNVGLFPANHIRVVVGDCLNTVIASYVSVPCIY